MVGNHLHRRNGGPRGLDPPYDWFLCECEFMLRRMFKGKIHRATVTEADLNYEGSLTLDPLLLEAADILPGEQVHVWNVTRGSRFTTYAIVGERGSGVVCVNGAGAHLAKVGDIVIVATFVDLPDEEARRLTPKVIFVNDRNQIVPSSATG